MDGLLDFSCTLSLLRGRARALRDMTGDPQLRWDLVEVESLAEVMMSRGTGLEAHARHANAAYLSNVLSAIEDRVAARERQEHDKARLPMTRTGRA